MQYIFPAFQADRFKSLLEFFDRLITARILDMDIAFVSFCAESDDFGGAHIALQVSEHCRPVGLRRIDAEDLLPFLTVKIVKVYAAFVDPGLLFELFMETVDIFFAVNDQDVQDVFIDRRVCPYIVARARSGTGSSSTSGVGV